mgnify:CR=1 FL=1
MSKSKNKIGTCKLCQTENVILRDSHILPKWGYKMIKDGSKDFIEITPQKSHYTNREHKEYLLCHECEQRFGKGENYIRNVLDRYYNQKELFNIVTLEPNELTNPDANFIYPASSIDEEKVAYFATSIIWRAVVSSKKPDNLYLAEYQEEVRQYLDEQISFPNNASLILYLHNRHCSPVHEMMTVPKTDLLNGNYCHQFFFYGMLFMLVLGKSIPPEIKKISLINGDTPSIIITSLGSPPYIDGIREAVKNTKATGRLAKEDSY